VKNKERKIYLDIIRILAIFLVLFTHTGTNGVKMYTISKGILQYVYAMFDCFRTINNPLLFMISGALLLGRNEELKVILKKRVVRFVIALLIFSYAQAIWNFVHAPAESIFNIWEIFKGILSSPIRSQYWYLYSYISFLLMLPFLRSMAQRLDDKQFRYLFALSIIVLDIFRLLTLMLGIEKINFSIFLSSFTTLYPLLGYYIDKHSDKYMKRWMYPVMSAFALVCIILAAKMTLWDCGGTGKWSEKYITLFYTFTAVAVFTLIKKAVSVLDEKELLKPVIIRFIQFASSTTFGIYLLENILETFTRPVFIVLDRYIPRILACVIWLVATMLFGNIVVGIMKKVPGLRKIL